MEKFFSNISNNKTASKRLKSWQKNEELFPHAPCKHSNRHTTGDVFDRDVKEILNTNINFYGSSLQCEFFVFLEKYEDPDGYDYIKSFNLNALSELTMTTLKYYFIQRIIQILSSEYMNGKTKISKQIFENLQLKNLVFQLTVM